VFLRINSLDLPHFPGDDLTLLEQQKDARTIEGVHPREAKR
jgi:hypothetical protein